MDTFYENILLTENEGTDENGSDFCLVSFQKRMNWPLFHRSQKHQTSVGQLCAVTLPTKSTNPKAPNCFNRKYKTFCIFLGFN